MVTTTAGRPTNSSGGARPSSGAARQPKRRRRTRTRLRLDNDTGGIDEVEVSRSVAVTAAGAGNSDDNPEDNDADDDGGNTDDARRNQVEGGQRGGRVDATHGRHVSGVDVQDDSDHGRRRRHGGPARPNLSTKQEGRQAYAEPRKEDTLESMT
jgi:hypothetical protein